jgi:branched-chain amino acid transport system permease protein
MSGNFSRTWQSTLQLGLLGGGIALFLGLVGMVDAFSKRFIINGIITFGQILILGPILILSYMAVNRLKERNAASTLLHGAVAGLMGGAILVLFLLLGQALNLRTMFVNASPALYILINFGAPLPAGTVIPLAYGAAIGLLAGALYLLPVRLRGAIIQGILWVVILGLLRDLITTVVQQWGTVVVYLVWLFANSGLQVPGAIAVFILVVAGSYWNHTRLAAAAGKPAVQRPVWLRWTITIGGLVLMLFLPQILGLFFSDILVNVGLYILMALGLNIVVGYAGLLDLGYVAFFAIGAYTMGILTSPEIAHIGLSYWAALPIALFAAVAAGVILGLPVLRLRGDYLAIVTLGFGEIIRLLVLSDWLKPYLGGSQGIQGIARPAIGPWNFASPQQQYYLLLVFIGIAMFVAWRLKDSRLGRAWMAMREDEDVAQAMGINLISTKLLAFGTGALFSGLSGTIFAARLTSAYPSSFGFLVSINVLAVIIIGGLGSIPGVIVGGLVLVGFPELLREFAEFRLLVYGAVLVAMMLLRPEGLWPEARRRLELHDEADAD